MCLPVLKGLELSCRVADRANWCPDTVKRFLVGKNNDPWEGLLRKLGSYASNHALCACRTSILYPLSVAYNKSYNDPRTRKWWARSQILEILVSCQLYALSNIYETWSPRRYSDSGVQLRNSPWEAVSNSSIDFGSTTWAHYSDAADFVHTTEIGFQAEANSVWMLSTAYVPVICGVITGKRVLYNHE